MDSLLSLVNATEYKGHKIREWNIVQFARLTPILTGIVKQFKEKQISFEQFSGALSETDGAGMMNFSSSALDFLAPVLEKSPEILKLGLNLKQEQVEELSFSDGAVLTLLTLKVNLEHMTSFFGALVAKQEEAVAS